MNKILGIVFLLATILIGMISNGKVKLDNIWVILIFILQITSWIGYINLLDIEKLILKNDIVIEKIAKYQKTLEEIFVEIEGDNNE